MAHMLQGLIAKQRRDFAPVWMDKRSCKVRLEYTRIRCLYLIQCGQLVGNRSFSELFSDFQTFLLWTVPTQMLFFTKIYYFPFRGPFPEATVAVPNLAGQADYPGCFIMME
jgi:hypothetical protein